MASGRPTASAALFQVPQSVAATTGTTDAAAAQWPSSLACELSVKRSDFVLFRQVNERIVQSGCPFTQQLWPVRSSFIPSKVSRRLPT